MPSVVTVAEDGVTLTEFTTGGGAGARALMLMVMLADADLVVSATLVAVTVAEPAVAGAVYSPAELIVPAEAFQVTDLLVTVP